VINIMWLRQVTTFMLLPLQMVAMEDRPDAFVGIAAVDRGENDNPSSTG
jgi:hypothetical protein